MLTAAVRDLHCSNPGQFITDVRTSCPQLWENNPHLVPLDEFDPDVEKINCHYPLIHQSNHGAYHFIHGFMQYISSALGVEVKPTEFKGDIHLSNTEKLWYSQIHELLGQDVPFWIVAAGGKHDYTIKWWEISRFQAVIDHFKGRILFVQIGESGHYHPPLNNVIDLRGKTDLRQLIRLTYHAQGVLCPVTMLMHLAVAVETKTSPPKQRSCVVIAGGREPTHWEAYPHHQFIHTIGALACCDDGGCWKSRTLPLGDGDPKDQPEHLCVDTINFLPRCMDLITPDVVVQRIECYFRGGVLNYLNANEFSIIRDCGYFTNNYGI